jgi:UDP-N-acetylmuramyl pentapeptide phosphotransferase/UDP-N-acetylglucosamine-1-phosphate transferase
MLSGSLIAFTFSLLSIAVVYVLLSFLRNTFIKAGYYGRDVHKPGQPKVAEMGGIASSIVVLSLVLALYFLLPSEARQFDLVLAFVFLYYFLLGLVDDLLVLPGKVKLFGTLFGGVLADFLGTFLRVSFYDPRPYLPFIGQIHGIFFLYPLLIPVGLAVTSNAYNMYDVYNGTLTFASMLTFALLGVLVLFADVARFSALVSIFSFICSGASAGLYLLNRYPSKFFIGDAGSLSLGAAVGMIAIMGRLEVVAMVAIMPMLMNGFLSFGSVGKIFERHQIRERPVIVQNGLISANPKAGAPMSLANILASKTPLTEKQIIFRYHVLTILGIILACITFILIPW